MALSKTLRLLTLAVLLVAFGLSFARAGDGPQFSGASCDGAYVAAPGCSGTAYGARRPFVFTNEAADCSGSRQRFTPVRTFAAGFHQGIMARRSSIQLRRYQLPQSCSGTVGYAAASCAGG